MSFNKIVDTVVQFILFREKHSKGYIQYCTLIFMPSDAGTGRARGAPAPPPIFGRSVNPIPIGEGSLSPPITAGTPNVFHLPASLNLLLKFSDL